VTIVEFVLHVLALRTRFKFSVTSWGRTQARNTEVGGHVDSRHLSWEALDVVVEPPSDANELVRVAMKIGLRALDEGDHVHLQVP